MTSREQRGPAALRRRFVLLAAVMLGTLTIAVGGLARGHAAGMPVSSAAMSVFHPGELPPVCTPGSETLIATADTWVDQNAPTNNMGTQNTMRVVSRATNRNARVLVIFALPAVPAGCTLASATLRLNATGATNGRTISVYQADAAWGETTATWNNQPGMSGTAVDGASGTGWRQWTVTDHVQAMYGGSNNGFVLCDAAENGAGTSTQTYATRTAASNKPELVLTWG